MKQFLFLLAILFTSISCSRPTTKQFYLLNYQPDRLNTRISSEPYPFIVRMKPFEIEKAYSKPNLAYRKNPYELAYYGYQHWAVRPRDMMTDLLYTHLESIQLVRSTVRRLDEQGAPDYELAGRIIALEEYDSDDTWFAHLAVRMTLTRLSDNEVLYNRLFDQRKIVERHEPLYVVRTLSELTDYFASSLINELDQLFFEETQRIKQGAVHGGQ